MHHVRVVQLSGGLDNCYICDSSSQRSNLWHMSLHRTTLHGFHIVWRKIGHLRMQETFLSVQSDAIEPFLVEWPRLLLIDDSEQTHSSVGVRFESVVKKAKSNFLAFSRIDYQRIHLSKNYRDVPKLKMRIII